MDIPGGGSANMDDFRKHCRFKPLPHNRYTRVVRVLSSIPEFHFMIIELVELDLNAFSKTAEGSDQSSPDTSYWSRESTGKADIGSDTTADRPDDDKSGRKDRQEPICSCASETERSELAEAEARHQVRYHVSPLTLEHQHTIPVSFDALSYTWGSPFIEDDRQDSYSSEHDVAITVLTWPKLKHTVLIRRNLYEALCAIFETGRDRYIWVDALCINQHDPMEKAVQIPLMSIIFSEAETVIAWPGVEDPEEPVFELAIEVCGIISSDAIRYAEAQWETITTELERYDVFVRKLNIAFTGKSINAWLKLLSRKIFQRGWVLQELALARQPCILLRGSLYAFDQFALAGEISWYKHSSLAKLAPCLKIRNIFGLWQIKRVTDDLRQVRQGSKHISELAYFGYGASNHREHMVAVLLYMLCFRTARICTDPRDYIYSVLGLVSTLTGSRDTILTPDHSKTTEQVFRDVAELTLRTLPHLDILTSAGLHDDDSDISALPSWVPDFRTTQNASKGIVMNPKHWLPSTAFTAGFEDAEHTGLEIQGDLLRLSARQCGTVRHEVFVDDLGSYDKRRDYLEPLRRLWLHVSALEAQYNDGSDTFEALHRVWWYCGRMEQSVFNRRVAANLVVAMIIAIERSESGKDDSQIWQQQLDSMHNSLVGLQDRSGIPSAKDMAFLATYADMCPATTYGERLPEEVQTPYRTYLETAQGLHRGVTGKRTVFITDKNSIGMAWSKVRSGDELWLLCQARVPYILRPTGTGTYIIVKDAFVPGAMQGEYIRNGVAGEIQRITIE